MILAELWDICIKFMWGEEYILGLDNFLKLRKIKTILDCAGGTGFPAIVLKKRGWDVTYSDGSKQMFDFFENELKKGNLQIPHYFVNWHELSKKFSQKFDAVLLTVPSQVAVKLIKFPKNYTQQLLSIPHLWAQTLILETDRPILKKTYWLNINDRSYPFIAVVQHTNFIDKKHYGGRHIAYIGNYLPDNHPYLKLTKEQLEKRVHS